MVRVALVIGGASGMGAATAALLAENSFDVAVADICQGQALTVANRLPGGRSTAFAVDIAKESNVISLFDHVERDLGDVSALVVAAGVSGLVDHKAPRVADTDIDDWDRVMAVNARGMFLAVREMFRRRRTCPLAQARVVVIGSMAVQNGGLRGPATYTASKGAVMAFVKAASQEAIELGMTINSVAPGAIDTPMLRSVLPPESDASFFSTTAIGRAGTPEEVAAAVAFLVSPSASYINGASIDVNGGMSLR